MTPLGGTTDFLLALSLSVFESTVRQLTKTVTVAGFGFGVGAGVVGLGALAFALLELAPELLELPEPPDDFVPDEDPLWPAAMGVLVGRGVNLPPDDPLAFVPDEALAPGAAAEEPVGAPPVAAETLGLDASREDSVEALFCASVVSAEVVGVL